MLIFAKEKFYLLKTKNYEEKVYLRRLWLYL